ncbi:MAG: TetR/AcrR family transcriptional regulator [Oscillospiraceae bacterium]|nr:TetR/AcrR family transcriptional regulator [Oscillospiraceae bacterium]
MIGDTNDTSDTSGTSGTNDRLARLDPAREKRIVDAGFAEFRDGYKSASTAVIARGAGISKGLLFHYFNTKHALFWHLVHRAASAVNNGFASAINLQEGDLFRRMLQAAYAKLELSFECPRIFAFLAGVTRGGEPEMADAAAWLRENMGAASLDDDRLIAGVCHRRFRDGIDLETAVSAIRLALSARLQEEMDRLDVEALHGKGADHVMACLEHVMAGFQGYVDLFQKVFYAS